LYTSDASLTTLCETQIAVNALKVHFTLWHWLYFRATSQDTLTTHGANKGTS